LLTAFNDQAMISWIIGGLQRLAQEIYGLTKQIINVAKMGIIIVHSTLAIVAIVLGLVIFLIQ